MNALLLAIPFLAGCSFGKMVDDDGHYNRLFPASPLSEAPCIEDQDCVITHLIDGECCPDPEYSPSNLYTRDQYDQLVAHQAQICAESQGTYTCPQPGKQGHVQSVNHGVCIQNRCVIKAVPVEDPAAPLPPPAPPVETSAVPTQTQPIPTVASPAR